MSLNLDDSGIPIPPPSSHAENQTPRPASLPIRPKARPIGATYVRALKPSEKGVCPHFEKGEILRVIWEPVRLEGFTYVTVISLKPPGDMGAAPIESFKVADQEEVDEVGRRAGTEEEKETFKRVVEWED